MIEARTGEDVKPANQGRAWLRAVVHHLFPPKTALPQATLTFYALLELV
jgi:hypothetical protein